MERPPVDLIPRRSPDLRCPLCHDQLADVDPITCSGCGTPHHAACLAELGECATLGCGSSPPGELGARRPTEVFRREVRERIRRRARSYRAHVKPGPRHDPELLRLLQDACVEPAPLHPMLVRFGLGSPAAAFAVEAVFLTLFALSLVLLTVLVVSLVN